MLLDAELLDMPFQSDPSRLQVRLSLLPQLHVLLHLCMGEKAPEGFTRTDRIQLLFGGICSRWRYTEVLQLFVSYDCIESASRSRAQAAPGASRSFRLALGLEVSAAAATLHVGSRHAIGN